MVDMVDEYPVGMNMALENPQIKTRHLDGKIIAK